VVFLVKTEGLFDFHGLSTLSRFNPNVANLMRYTDMGSKQKALLLIDGVVNFILGVLLLLYPVGIMDLLGLPPTDTYFYASILGAVLFGIGIALLIELYGESRQVRGLGLGGAIAINLSGAGALILWLVIRPFSLPIRGKIILWSVAIAVLAIALAEIVTRSWQYQGD
jgi:hypothetical protein